MTGENIVCFAKDWTEDPTSNNHVMRLLARENKVLWLNSIATRSRLPSVNLPIASAKCTGKEGLNSIFPEASTAVEAVRITARAVNRSPRVST